MRFPFTVFNAFSIVPFGGNPAAVFINAQSIPEQCLQAIARKLNLVETVFVYPALTAGADFHLRYFSPRGEIPIAGHPTISAWAALAESRIIDLSTRSHFTQETAPGRQKIEVDGSGAAARIWMEQPAPVFGEVIEDRGSVAAAFGLLEEDLEPSLPVQGVSVGLGHLIVPLRNLEALARAQRLNEALTKLCALSKTREAQLFAFGSYEPGFDLHTRNLSPREGIEDPACGNGNGALGAFLARNKFAQPGEVFLRAEQGRIVGMPSSIEIRINAGREIGALLKVAIGGMAIKMVEGEILI